MATTYGGGRIYVRDNSILTLGGTNSFVSNSARQCFWGLGGWGGGIYAHDHTVVNMSTNTAFIHNSAGVYGGGIYAYHSEHE